MQCIILHIEVPISGDFSYEQSGHWSAITDALSKLCKQNKDTCELGRSCWLIPVYSGLPELAAAIHHADKAGFPYKILNFDKLEEWVIYR